MKKLLLFAFVPVFAGCLSSVEPSVTYWPMGFDASSAIPAAKPSFGVVRISQIVTNPPYDGSTISVLRSDGSIAFDSFNRFAANPSHLLRGAAFDAISATGMFEYVVVADSIVDADLSLEIVISNLYLDCRTDGERKAVVGLLVRLANNRRVKSVVIGSGVADAADGDYAKAFSTAFSKAIVEAMRNLR